ncbi:MAG: hypothetical protein KatS3mg095_0199 [Candidatus Parcubacteria bacterium]|nr:MAG: hypothetical protein KatS3mg095_0199 [Candidatus Parcubacteria bacterium]
MINKIIFNNIFYYLSPLFALLILLLIFVYINLKVKKIKILPKDYLKFYHYERKLKTNFQISRYSKLIFDFFINFLIKIFQISKIHFLRWQLWAEKNLNNLKDLKEQKNKENISD